MQKDINVFTLLPDREQNERQCDQVCCVGPMVKYRTNSNGAPTVRTFLIGWELSLNSTSIFSKFFTLWHEIIFSICVIGNSEKYLIRVAMREWEKYTCLRFRKRQSEYNYIMFQDNFGWVQKSCDVTFTNNRKWNPFVILPWILTSAAILSWAWSVEGSLWI